MTAEELAQYLHAHIPLSRAMQVAVVAASPDGVVLGAPLAPNINHRDTVFGGSASALAILAAWSLLYLRLQHAGEPARLVIQRNHMNYDAPIRGAFTATAGAPDAAAWERFLRALRRRGAARVAVTAALAVDGQPAGRFEGEFVALRSRGV